ncbi:hemagglutinin repeat-containing protein [Bordetella bronchiseptica]|uniref:two-partner secretion domain-containing protein n=1 Tax=Bordetella bronchiseptica TaxID=518 RepID=UPI002740637B|nr:hemagglutinin repeat-containing protein [Bordetella bronchiseptica]WLS56915.1 hemagglutinin repeat-containing protein [Bordetella bronchiseptica]WLS61750.1 hemagglutinin repeat-containing protein [Bordetella bronchiseptica]
MNTNLYRLVFSHVRGMLVPVSEHCTVGNTSCGRTRGQARSGARATSLSVAPNALAWALMLACAGLPLVTHAQGLVPQGQTQVLQGGNKVPVVNIANPNSGGVSHNKFQQFNVANPGVVFNNGLTDGVSRIGGALTKNPNLTRQASAILAEVTGTSPSRLAGTLEVYGKGADLIIANPNGISVNGLSTLNASNLTLTTGRPSVNGGRIGLDVQQGTVTIERGGVNATGLGYFDVVARLVKLQGAVSSEQGKPLADIAVVAGANRYDHATRRATPIAAGARGAAAGAYAIDGTAAGAMYGKHITLVSSDSGLGVRQLGSLSSPSAITVSSQGEIALGDATVQRGPLSLKGAGAVSAGKLASGGAVSVAGGGAVTVASASSVGNLAVQGGGKVQATLLNAGGTLQVSGRQAVQLGTASSRQVLSVSAGGALKADQLSATRRVDVDGKQTVALGSASSNALSVRAGGVLKADQLSATGRLEVDGKQAVTLGSAASRNALSVRAGGALKADQLSATGRLEVDGKQAVTLESATSRNALSVNAGAALQADKLSATGRLDVHGKQAVTLGSAASGDALSVSAGAALQADKLSATGRLDVHGKQAVMLGSTASGDALSVSAGAALQADQLSATGQLEVDGKQAVMLGSAASGDALSVSAGGNLQAKQLVSSAQLEVRGQREVALDDASSVRGMTVAAAGTLAARNLQSKGAIRIQGGEAVSVANANSDAELHVSGRGQVDLGDLSAARGADITGEQRVSIGRAHSDGDVKVAARGALSIDSMTALGAIGVQAGDSVSAKDMRSRGAVTVSGGGSVNLGDVQSDGQVRATSAGAMTVRDAASAADLALQAGGALQAGFLKSAGAMTVNGRDAVRLDGAQAGGQLRVSSDGQAALGSLAAKGALTVSAARAATVAELKSLGNVSVTGGERVSVQSVNSASRVAISAHGALEVGKVSAKSGIGIEGWGAVAADSLGSDGAISVSGRDAVRVDHARSLADISLGAEGGATLGAVEAAGSIDVRGGSTVAANSLRANRDVRVSGKDAVRVTAATSGGGLHVSSGRQLDLGAVQARGALALDGGAGVALQSAKAGGTLHVQGGEHLDLGTLAAVGAVDVNGTGDVRVAKLVSDAGADLQAGRSMTLGTVDTTGDLQARAQQELELGSVKTEGGLQAAAGGALSLAAAEVAGALELSGQGVTVDRASASRARIDSTGSVGIGALKAGAVEAASPRRARRALRQDFFTPGSVVVRAQGNVTVGRGDPHQGVLAQGDIVMDAKGGTLLLRNDVLTENGTVTISADSAVLEHSTIESKISQSALAAKGDKGKPAVSVKVAKKLFLNGTLRAVNDNEETMPGRQIDVVDGRPQITDAVTGEERKDESVVSDAALVADGGPIVVEAGELVSHAGGIGNGRNKGNGASVTVRTTGNLVNKGYISAGKQGVLEVGGALTNEFLVGSDGTQRIEAQRIENRGTFQSQAPSGTAGALVVKAAEAIVHDGVMATEGEMQIAGKGGGSPAVTAGAKATTSANKLSVDVASWDNAGSLDIKKGGAQVTAAGRYAEHGKVSIQGDYTVSADAIALAAQVTQRGGAANLTSRHDTRFSNNIRLMGPLQVSAGGAVSNTGNLKVREGVRVTAASFDNEAGAEVMAKSAALTTSGAVRNAGKMQVKEAATIVAASVSNPGTFTAGKDLTVTSRGGFDNNGKMESNKDIVIKTEQFGNAGVLDAKHDLTVTASGQADNRGSLKAGHDFTVQAQRIDNSGTMAAGHDATLKAPHLRNTGQIVAGHDIHIINSAKLENTGRVDARNDLVLDVEDFTNTGSLYAEHDATLTLAQGTQRDLVVDQDHILPVAEGTLRVKAKSLTTEIETGNSGSLIAEVQENIDNKQAIVVGKDLTLSSAHGNVANEANALLWAAGDLTVKAQNITNERAALIEAGGNARLTAAVALLNKLGRIRAGEDMHLDAPRIENTAKLSGEVQRKGVQDVGGGEYGRWSGIGYVNYWLRAGNGKKAGTIAAPWYGGDLTAEQSLIEVGKDLYLNAGARKDEHRHLLNEGVIQAGGHGHIGGDVDNRSVVRTVSAMEYFKTPLPVSLTALDNRAGLSPATWNFNSTYELLDYLLDQNRYEYIWGVYPTYTEWSVNTLKNLNLGYQAKPAPTAPPMPKAPELDLRGHTLESAEGRKIFAEYKKQQGEYEKAKTAVQAVEAYGEATRRVHDQLGQRYGKALGGMDAETKEVDGIIQAFAADLRTVYAKQADQASIDAETDKVAQRYKSQIDAVRLEAIQPGRVMLAKALSAALGADWRALGHAELMQRWKDFKAGKRGANIAFYPKEQTVLAAGAGLTLSNGAVHNGENAAQNRGRPENLKIGAHSATSVGGSFDALRDVGLEKRLDIDDALAAVLVNPHIFTRIGAAQASLADGAAGPALARQARQAPGTDGMVDARGLGSADALASLASLDAAQGLEVSGRRNAQVADARLAGPSAVAAPAVGAADVGVEPVAGDQVDQPVVAVGFEQPAAAVRVAPPAVALPRPLFETRIKFIDQSKFYGSRYFFEQIGYKPDRAARVAGDNYFDTTLVREQVRRALGGYESRLPVRGVALVAKLMDSAGTVGKALGLKVGVAPTAQQLKQADRDFVWYVDTVIDGQKVLAPRLYLTEATRQGITDQYAGGGALIASGGDVNVDTNGHDVSSVNGLIQGKRVKVDAGKGRVLVADSKGTGGGIEADDEVDVSAQDIDIEGGKLRGKDVKLKADTVKVATSMRYDDKGRLAARGDGALDAQGGQLHIEAKRLETAGATLKGSKVKLDVDDVKLGGVYEAGSSYENKSSTPLGSLFAILSSTTETNQSARANHYGTRIAAGTLEGKMQNLEIEGGSVEAAHTDLSVARDASFKAAADFAHTEHEKDVRQLSLGAKVGAGGYEAGFSLGSESGLEAHAGRGMTAGAEVKVGYQASHEQSSETEKSYRNANLNFGGGSVEVGNVLDIGGADINRNRYGGAAKGKAGAEEALRMRAKKVESTKYVSEQTSQSSGWSVEVAATASARSSVLTAATRLGDSVAQNVEDGREIRGELMAAQVAAEATQLVTADTAAVALSAGISADFDSSHSRSTSQNTQYLGGNLSIEATEGDATLVGAKFGGGDQVSLKAAKNVNLMAAESTFESHSESHNFHASADANLGANAVQGAVGLGLTAGMGTSHQITNETGKTYAGTSVDAANVSIDAGKDLNLSGSRVRGKHVVLDVEGDINATSKQDERNYNSSGGGWDVSAGVAIQNRTLVAPVGSAGFNFNTEHDNSRLTNDGAAGVVASDGLTGHVKGDANLTGATIADLSDKGNLKVDGAVNAQNLKDYRDKDGGSGGLNVGISSTTLAPTVGVAFGRVAGEDYQAEQRATIDVGQAKDPSRLQVGGGVKGTLNQDAAKATVVQRNKHWAGGGSEFSVAGKSLKKKNQVRPVETPTPDAVDGPPSRPTTPPASPQPIRATVEVSSPPPVSVATVEVVPRPKVETAQPLPPRPVPAKAVPMVPPKVEVAKVEVVPRPKVETAQPLPPRPVVAEKVTTPAVQPQLAKVETVQPVKPETAKPLPKPLPVAKVMEAPPPVMETAQPLPPVKPQKATPGPVAEVGKATVTTVQVQSAPPKPAPVAKQPAPAPKPKPKPKAERPKPGKTTPLSGRHVVQQQVQVLQRQASDINNTKSLPGGKLPKPVTVKLTDENGKPQTYTINRREDLMKLNGKVLSTKTTLGLEQTFRLRVEDIGGKNYRVFYETNK